MAECYGRGPKRFQAGPGSCGPDGAQTRCGPPRSGGRTEQFGRHRTGGIRQPFLGGHQAARPHHRGQQRGRDQLGRAFPGLARRSRRSEPPGRPTAGPAAPGPRPSPPTPVYPGGRPPRPRPAIRATPAPRPARRRTPRPGPARPRRRPNRPGPSGISTASPPASTNRRASTGALAPGVDDQGLHVAPPAQGVPDEIGPAQDGDGCALRQGLDQAPHGGVAVQAGRPPPGRPPAGRRRPGPAPTATTPGPTSGAARPAGGRPVPARPVRGPPSGPGRRPPRWPPGPGRRRTLGPRSGDARSGASAPRLEDHEIDGADDQHIEHRPSPARPAARARPAPEARAAGCPGAGGASSTWRARAANRRW